MPTVALTTGDIDAIGTIDATLIVKVINIYFHNHSAGSDYDAISVTLTFGEGDRVQCARINITDDSCVKPDQTFSVDINNLQNSPSLVTLGTDISAVVTIFDDGECIIIL